MKNILMSASVATIALVASALSASAASTFVACPPANPCSLGVVVDPVGPDNQFDIGFADAGTGSQTFTFQVSGDTSFAGLVISESAATTTLSSLRLQQVTDLITLTPTGSSWEHNPCSTVGSSSTCSITVSTGLASGFYLATLAVVGNNLFTGNANFTFSANPGTGEVPLPGALLLMGSVLMGGAGFAKWRKGTARLAA